MNSEHFALKTRLGQFLDGIPFDDIAAHVSVQTGNQTCDISRLLDTCANESQISFDLVARHLEPSKRILEVGAGLCITSLFLKSEGYDIVALEPAMGGFSMFEKLKNAVLKHYAGLQLQVVTEPAQALNSANYGQFDLIFSNNVIEHIPDWQSALTAMSNVLTPHGSMIHACPNYSLPYEPHYGVPVFRRLPALSRRLFLSPKSDSEIWDSLNFITCKNIRDYSNRSNLTYCFKRELLYHALKRMENDPLFRERHRGLIAAVAAFVMRSGLGELTRHIPPAMATPMIVEISKELQPEEH